MTASRLASPMHLHFAVPTYGHVRVSWHPDFPEPYDQFVRALKQFGDIIAGGTVVSLEELALPRAYQVMARYSPGSPAVACRSNKPEVTSKLSVLFGGLFERFPSLRGVDVAMVIPRIVG
jgi:hypothetical protein